MSIQDYFDQSCDDDIEIDEPLHLQPTATYPIGVTLNPTGVQQALDDYERLQRENERLRAALTEIANMGDCKEIIARDEYARGFNEGRIRPRKVAQQALETQNTEKGGE